MGQQGSLTFFSTREASEPAPVIATLMREVIGSDRTWIATRTYSEDRAWDQWRRLVASGFTLDDEEEDEEWLPKGLTPEEAGASFRPGTRLTLMHTGTNIARWIHDPLSRIDKSVRAEFVPGDPVLTAGWHDIWETSENDDGTLFGRAFISLALSGYGTPNDWREYRRQVFQVPEVIELQHRLEKVLGPVERCIYWSV